MAITSNQEFKVVQVATLAQYNDISTKDPATAYWVVSAKKIYLDGVAYGFDFTTDVTATNLSGIISTESSDTLTLTLSVVDNKLQFTGAVKLADYINKSWATSSLTNYTLDIGDPTITSQTAFNSYLRTRYPAKNYAVGTIARGCNGDINASTYYYASISASDGDSLLDVTDDGITLLKEDINGLADSRIQTLVLDQKGVASGFAELDSGGKVPPSQLPSYIDDVLTYDSVDNFPTTGADGVIYIAEDTGKVYRWTGSTYTNIATGNLVLGETSATAYRGDRGAAAYAHSQVTSGNPHSVSKSDIGLGSVSNYGVATESEAEAGTSDTKYMTPKKTKEAIDALAQKVTWTVIS